MLRLLSKVFYCTAVAYKAESRQHPFQDRQSTCTL
jgi:hypothetical protein